MMKELQQGQTAFQDRTVHEYASVCYTEDMNGLELSKKFYNEIGRPMLMEKFPDVFHRMAAGLSGEGSECFGYGDDISRDHDFGPGFCIWLNGEDYQRYGTDMQQEYDALPKSFMGFSEKNETYEAAGRVGVMSINGFFSRFLGEHFPPDSDNDWFSYEECLLAQAVNGEIFEDNSGEFTAARKLISKYPNRIRVLKIAESVHLLSQSGQYNYERSLKRGDRMAAYLSANRFIEEALHLSHLLYGKYEPYYKWAWKSFSEIPGTDEISSLLAKLPEYAYGGDEWRAHIIIERICSYYLRQLKTAGLSYGDDSLLEMHVRNILRS